jgi:uroporphyrinogen decarboxylase
VNYMDYKERFKKTIAHEETDRVPMDLWLDSNDPKIMENLIEYVGVKTYDELLDYLDIDFYRMKTPVAKELKNSRDRDLMFFIPNTENKGIITHSSSFYRPLINAEKPQDIETYNWPSPDIFDYAGLVPMCREHKNRVLWTQAGTWSPIFCKLCELFGMEKVLVDMIINPSLIEAAVDRIFDFYYNAFKNTLEAGKGWLDVFCFGDDYASQDDLIFDIKYWRKFFKKPFYKLCELIKSYDVLIAFHSCGAITSLIPEFIEAGVDILFPIQPKAKGMEPQALKKEFGRYLTFYGGIDVQQLLPFGTEQQVREGVRSVVKVLGEGGGYIMASSHTILRDIPIPNILAMYDEAKKLAV